MNTIKKLTNKKIITEDKQVQNGNITENKISVQENTIIKELEEEKNKEIEELKQKVNELIESTNEITLKFKIGGGNDNDDISIKVKGNSKIVEVLGLLYELCPNLNKMNIKGFCLEGKEDQKIDELKTVHENKLENGSLIVLMV